MPEANAYLIVVPVAAYRLNPNQFAIEGAFAGHLKLLRQKLGVIGVNMVLAAPYLSEQSYQVQKNSMAVIDERRDGIRFNGIYAANLGRLGYYKHLPAIVRALKKEVLNAAVLHAGPSNLQRPFEFLALWLGRRAGKVTISFTDIDQRDSARMNYATGRWSLKEYLVTKWIHDVSMHLQHRYAAKYFSLVVFKGLQLVADYGLGRPNVKYILDSAFGDEQIIPQDTVAQKTNAVLDPANPVELTYFGRLVEYKGIDHMLHAVRYAVDRGAKVRFHVIGDGPQRDALVHLTHSLGLESVVVFHGAIPFGPALFAQLYRLHILLAAPLSQDTPRSALDAAASAQTVISYDTYYYRELAQAGAPVEVVPWLDKNALGEKIVDVAADRQKLAANMAHAVQFAKLNTQEIWLDRRIARTRSLVPPTATPTA